MRLWAEWLQTIFDPGHQTIDQREVIKLIASKVVPVLHELVTEDFVTVEFTWMTQLAIAGSPSSRIMKDRTEPAATTTKT